MKINGLNFLESLLLGSNGSYCIINNVYVKFKKIPYPPNVKIDNGNYILRSIDYCASKFLDNRILPIFLLSPLHVFIHEIGHVLAYKILSKDNEEITVNIDSTRGVTHYPSYSKLDNGEKLIVNIAGPFVSIMFSTSMLAVNRIFKNFLPWPVSLILKFSAITYISGELWYAYASATNKIKGDFGSISAISKNHLLIATAVLVSQCAMAMLIAYIP